jgi:hypothetical protein
MGGPRIVGTAGGALRRTRRTTYVLIERLFSASVMDWLKPLNKATS